MSSSSNNIFWIKQPSVLFSGNKIFSIIPNSGQNLATKLNSLTRTCIILFIIILIIPQTRKYWYFPIILILIIVIYYFYSKNKADEDFVDQIIIDSADSGYEVNGPVLSKTKNIGQKLYLKNGFENEAKSSLDKNLYKRQTDDMDTFAKWVYSTPETCKENSANCHQYEDLRFNRN